ncbi:hypothetical protein [Pedobacter steynii]|uniref:Uncharacterized protein n=1 Tax=Pedobacter steynii TaxID=430522 RepID=A0A1D7QFB5_9SPHI|nr:hypothetical protein [Pedobacter steynii]AOM77382.1 hypothetical protein BFS30_09520 [Pedobacter steynii]
MTLAIHSYLVEIIGSLESGDRYLKKRSFASKYLHFHHPELFFIYDSRAKDAMRQFNSIASPEFKKMVKIVPYDQEYAVFAFKCLQLKGNLNSEGIEMNNRELDNLLIEIANERIRVKMAKSHEPIVV